MTEVFELVERHDAPVQRDLFLRSVGERDERFHLLARLQALLKTQNGDLLVALHAKRLPGRALLKRQRQNAHAHEIRAMDSLEALGDDGANAQKARALGRPVARGAIAVFGARKDHQRGLFSRVFHRGVVDRQLLARGIMDRHTAFEHRAVGGHVHEVLDADVGERAAHHHFMVAATRAVLVKISLAHLTISQPATGGRGELDGAGRRDVVGRDLVAEQRQNAGVLHVLHGRGSEAHVLEIGRVLDVGGGHVPLVGLARRRLHLAPVDVALEHVGIAFLEDFLGDELADEALNFLRGRPDVAQENFFSSLVGSNRLLREILRYGTSQRIRDDQRRRGQIIGLHVGADAAFEIAVAGENRGGDDPVLVDAVRHFSRQRAGIADAGRAAKAHDVEPELVEVLLQAGIGEVLANHLRARRKRGLHPRLHHQALGDRLAGEQAGADQNAGV